jgi:hypothetical protein
LEIISITSDKIYTVTTKTSEITSQLSLLENSETTNQLSQLEINSTMSHAKNQNYDDEEIIRGFGYGSNDNNDNSKPKRQERTHNYNLRGQKNNSGTRQHDSSFEDQEGEPSQTKTSPHDFHDWGNNNNRSKNKGKRKADEDDDDNISEDDRQSVLNIDNNSERPVQKFYENLNEQIQRLRDLADENGQIDQNQLLCIFIEGALNWMSKPHEYREYRMIEFPEFKEGNQDPIEWLKAFERACESNHISKKRRISLVASFLKKTALIWFNRQDIVFWNYLNQPNRSFVHLFKKEFCSPFKLSQWKHQLRSRKQKPGETIEKYTATIKEL